MGNRLSKDVGGRNSTLCAGNLVTQYGWTAWFELGCLGGRKEGGSYILSLMCGH